MDLTLLHTGIGHPDLTLLVLAAIGSFAVGTAAGVYATLRNGGSEANDPVEN